MARKPAPWYRKERNQWFVKINGRRHCLGEHPTDAPKPKKGKTGWNAPKEIVERFHKIYAQPEQRVTGECVAVVLDDFLAWTYENRAQRTADRYKDFLQSFTGKYGTLRISELNPGHVTRWLADQSWNSTTKRNAITAVSRAFNWAVKNNGLERNPIRGMEKPEAKRRTEIITPEEFEKLLAAIKDQPFLDLLIVSYDTGARPQEIKRLEARHIQQDKQRAVIPGSEAKGKIPRAVYFATDRSWEIVTRLIEQNPEGALFLNNRGNPWTGYAVKNRMEDLDHVLGRRVTQYSLRHAFITRKLIAGVDSHVVAALSGHRSTKMIDQTYSHIAQDHEFMLKAAKKGE